ncbi:MAG: membrane protein insertase YidC [Actinobacteria bacterium]|nr:membrane protein insertase YidC [Actinomycetota bacterium]
MSDIFDVPVDAAYYVVSALAGALTPLAGGLAVTIAIIVFTVSVRLLLLPFSYHALRGQLAQSRLAPQLQALRQRHRRDPDRLTREMKALYRANGTSMFAGYLPLLLQWPLLSVMYLLFRTGAINGAPNRLLHHHLFSAVLGAHWLTSPGPLSVQGGVFAALFVLLAVAGYLAVRISRRLFPVPARASAPTPAASRSPAASAPPAPAAPPAWLGRLTPLITVVFAAFLPLAGVLCLLTTTTWTLLERRVFARYLAPATPALTPRQAGS